MLIKRPADIRSSEITDEKLYLNRREFIRAAGIAAGAAAGAGVFWGAERRCRPPSPRRTAASSRTSSPAS